MITLEKIDMITERTGCTYKEAKEALESKNGDVVEAIIMLEEMYEDEMNEFFDKESKFQKKSKCKASSEDFKQIKDNLKKLIDKLNATRIVVYKEEKTLLDIPLSVGAVGGFFFMPATIVVIVGFLASGCSLKLFKEGGEIIDIKNFSKEYVDKIYDSFKDGDYKDKDDEGDGNN